MKDIKCKKHTFPSGAKLFYAKNDVNKLTEVRVYFDCGARVEDIPGLAHFSEHMFFTGTETKTKEQITKEYYDFINVNAATSTKVIYFTGKIFTEKLKEYFDTVGELILQSTFSEAAVEKERPIIEQEISGSNTQYRGKAYMFNRYNLTGQREQKDGVLGSKKTISTITEKEVKDFVHRYFVANNMEVVICSPLSFAKVKSILSKSLAKTLPVNPELQPMEYMHDSVKNSKFLKVKSVDIEGTYLYLNFKIDTGYADYVYLDKLNFILSMVNATTGGIMDDLRLEKSLVYSSWFDLTTLKDNSYLTFYTECETENINEVVKTVANYLNKINKNGFTQQQLDDLKLRMKHERMSEVRHPYTITERVYTNNKMWGKMISDKAMDKMFMNMTLEECNEIFRGVFAIPDVSMSIYGKAKKEDIMPKNELLTLFDFKDSNSKE